MDRDRLINSVAYTIWDVTEACVQRKITLGQQGEHTAALWALAQDLGIKSEVDDLLQTFSEQEMEKALERLLQKHRF